MLNLNRTSMLVLGHVMCLSNQGSGECAPSNTQLACIASVSERSIRRTLNRLQEAELICVYYPSENERWIEPLISQEEFHNISYSYEGGQMSAPDRLSNNIYIHTNKSIPTQCHGENNQEKYTYAMNSSPPRGVDESAVGVSLGGREVEAGGCKVKLNLEAIGGSSCVAEAGAESTNWWGAKPLKADYVSKESSCHESAPSASSTIKLDSIVNELNKEPVVMAPPVDRKDKGMMKAYRDSWAYFLLYHWELNGLQGNGDDEDSKYTVGIVSIELKGRHLEKLEAYSDNGIRLSVIGKSIKNYAEVLHCQDAYYSHRDTISDFVYKRMYKFLNPSSYRVGNMDEYL